MKKSYVTKRICDIPPSGIRRFFDLAKTMDNVISLGVGEPDFETPWHVREAAISSLEKGMTSYSANQGFIELRQAISDYLQKRYDLSYDPASEVVVTVGASEGIDIALRAITDYGDEILITEPSYVSYKPCITMAGGEPVVIETFEKDDFRLTPELLEEKITDKTKAIILPYPNNPTGGIMEKADLEAIAPIIKKHDLVVISDEIYSELTYGSKHVSIASIDGMRERTILLNGFSKAFAMTGWRLGFAAAPKEILRQMNKIHQFIIMCAPTMSQFAGIEALTSELMDEDIEIMREAYDERRRFLADSFRKMGLSCFEPRGAFYVFPCIKNTGFTSEEFCQKLLNEQRVAVVPGTAFGDCGEGFIRCSYAYSLDSLKIAVDKISEFVEKYRK